MMGTTAWVVYLAVGAVVAVRVMRFMVSIEPGSEDDPGMIAFFGIIGLGIVVIWPAAVAARILMWVTLLDAKSSHKVK